MSDKHLEELSALMDGEASELEVRRVLGNIGKDQALRQKWSRYQLAGSVLRGETQGRAEQWQGMDLSARVAQAIEAEPALIADAALKKRLGAGLMRPLTNMAVAASVSAAVILGWQNIQSPAPTVPGPVATTLPSASIGGMQPAGGNGLMQVAQGGSTSLRSAPSLSRQDIIRYNPAVDDELNEYLISHSGNAAVNTASGVAPYARVVALKPAKPQPVQPPVKSEK